MNEENKTDKSDYFKRELLSWLKTFAIVAIITLVFLQVFTNAKIPSSSMEKTIMTGDRLFGYNLAYWHNEPKRGDIIIFHYPDDPKEIYIKRIIGLPGDEVSFKEFDSESDDPYVKVLVNGKVLEEPYIKEKMETGPYDEEVYKVPDNSYFVMGDNRNESSDGRSWQHHFVPKENIISKAVFRYWPLNKMGGIS